MLIRKATYNDVKTLNNFLTLLIKDEKQYDLGIKDNFIVTNMYENYIEDTDKLIIVAEINNQVVAYLYGMIINEDETYKFKVAKLDALYVDPNNRNQKIATALIEYFKKWALDKQAKKIEVKVWSQNIKAKHLYEKNDFKTTSEILTIDM